MFQAPCVPNFAEAVRVRSYAVHLGPSLHAQLFSAVVLNLQKDARHIWAAGGKACPAWVPKACNLHHFSAEELDRKLAGRKVMMVGDSIQVQQFFSLRHMLRKVIVGPRPPAWGFFYTRSGAQFQLQAAQFLTGEPCCNHFEGQSLEVLDTAEWLQYSREADVLVLNTGHHWHRRDVSFSNYGTMVRNVMQTLRRHYKGVIIFRTSSWGHHRCAAIKVPLRNAREALDFGSLDNDPYHWMSPIFREHMWGDVAAEMGMTHRFRFANTSMTMLRGDGHLDRQQDAGSENVFDDCLHYCMPGVPDYWNWVLYNVLLSLEFNR
ncbi:hypothetical protein WJX73_005019 [Symbiochloris irregularis]|uniref:Trichome birefringence-like C-terminal domain-containing protein n=1 Tax=Symbiochloris irregularis TaxID=706552 RepID=A0AAW1NQK4_9CHLO